MKTTIWLTTNDLFSLHAGGIDRMYLWFQEPIRHIDARGLEKIEYSYTFLCKEKNRKIATKRAIPFIYQSNCPKGFPKNFEAAIEKLGGSIVFDTNNHYGYYIEIPNRNWKKRLALLIAAYNTDISTVRYFNNIPLGWIDRESNDIADKFISEHMGLLLLRTLLNKEDVTYKDMYGHTSYPAPNSPLHSCNILLNMEIEVGIGDDPYAYPIWITKMRDRRNCFGRKRIYVWFEPCTFIKKLISIGGDSPFADDNELVVPRRRIGDWTNTKGRGSNKAVVLNSLPLELQQIILSKIAEQKGVSWKKMKIELQFYIKPVQEKHS